MPGFESFSASVRGITDADDLRLLYELTGDFGSILELDALLRSVNEKVRQAFDAESSVVLLLDEAGGELFVPAGSEPDPAVEKRVQGLRFPTDRGLAASALEHARPVLIDDAAHDPHFDPELDRRLGPTKNLLYAPLASPRGTIGVITMRSKRAGAFGERHLAFLGALAGPIAIAIDNARVHEQLRRSETRLRTEVGALRRDLARRDRFEEIVGSGPAMREVFRLMERAAASAVPVLIEGESGTGKELVARGIHRASERADGPFLTVRCGALSESLLESELFGHRPGALPGATDDERGLFEAANGGTLLLDDVSEMPPSLQAKCLRVLQEGEVVAVGDVHPRRVDVRVLSATNRDLRAEVSASRFRQDLYHRIAVFAVRVPPLRERREDVSLLAARMAATAARREDRKIGGIDPEAVAVLERYDWPGNVGELANEMGRAVALTGDGEAISVRHLSAHLQNLGPEGVSGPVAPAGPGGRASSLRQRRAAFEARYISEVLRQSEGNVSRAARALGLSRVTLYKRLREYGIR
ncbi:MAG: hypothetical protein QOD06_3100 [Candidatus Binatota bacterium]|nr:hypothetical protein [Candidatus Binatota bacterium]